MLRFILFFAGLLGFTEALGKRRKICGTDKVDPYREHLRQLALRTSRLRQPEIAQFVHSLRASHLNHTPHYFQALKGLKDFRDLEGQDIFAFKETWTDEDTNMLERLDNRTNAWTQQGNLSTEGIRRRLPSVDQFYRLFGNEQVAIVGAGRSLKGKGLGASIDRHDVVVRFNNFAIGESDTGSRTTLQVVNRWVRGKPRVPLMDFEMMETFDSYRRRFNLFGKYIEASNALQAPMFLIRPSARCGMPDTGNHFTRGFLFAWFVGSLFKKMDLYGFAPSSGRFHLHPRLHAHSKVQEPWIEFEHQFYQQLLSVQAGPGVLF